MTAKGKRKQIMVEPHIKITEYRFERIHKFVYLGSLVNESNEMN
jgi:hypothetical protein